MEGHGVTDFFDWWLVRPGVREAASCADGSSASSRHRRRSAVNSFLSNFSCAGWAAPRSSASARHRRCDLAPARRLTGVVGGSGWSLRSIIVETCYQPPMSGYPGGVRVRPIPGEQFPSRMNVECPRPFRKRHPLGTRFRMSVRLTDRDGRGQFLMADFRRDYQVVG